jgi:hypothetical protein
MLQNFCDFRRFLTLFAEFPASAAMCRRPGQIGQISTVFSAAARVTELRSVTVTIFISILANVFRGFLKLVTVTDKNSKNFFLE